MWKQTAKTVNGRRVMLLFAMAAALASFLLPPFAQIPADYHTILWQSLPLSGVWCALAVVSIWLHGKRGAWALLGLPFALFYPAAILIGGIPPCYWTHTCR
ncbi:MAG TPA: hypothetical protein VN442_08665 [Bryobacteraceae bacterium]|nr:hypothetical protein [Bryobacteraceae bacterium]